MTAQKTVLHLDHTMERGGAEYALLRMLKVATPWTASLLLPRTHNGNLGVYEPLRTEPVAMRQCGPRQNSGASSRPAIALPAFALRALGQAIAIRLSHEFKTADIVHANTTRSAIYAALACLGTRKTLVVHARDLANEQSLGKWGLRLFVALALRRANGIIANSATTLAALPQLRQPSAVITSASGHLRTDRATAGSAAAGSAAAGLAALGSVALGSAALHPVARIGMVARLDPWKGQELLLRAFAAEFRDSAVRLVLAGSAAFGHAEYEKSLHHLATELHIAPQVDFVGHVENVGELISSLDICVQTSLRPEPLGQNVLQYLSHGRPTIAVNAGGPAEWIQDGTNGLLFEMGNLHSLRTALTLLASNRTLREQLSIGAHATPGLLTDAEIARQHGEFFDKIWAAHNPRPMRQAAEQGVHIND